MAADGPIPARLATAEAWVAVASMTTLCVYVCFIVANVVARYVFNAPLYFLGDLTEMLIPVAMALTFTVASIAGSHLVIRVLGSLLGRKARVLDTLGGVATAVLLILIGVKLAEYSMEMREGGRATSHVQIPVWPIWIIVTASFFGAAIGTVMAMLSGVRADTTAE